jgi:hypothetical protein
MNEALPLSNIVNQLDEWEKTTNKRSVAEMGTSKVKLPSLSNTDEVISCLASRKKEFAAKKFRPGFDHRVEIERSLEVISTSHSNESNPITKYALIENGSKLLKKELEEMQRLVQREVEEKQKKLTEARKEHHRLYE